MSNGTGRRSSLVSVLLGSFVLLAGVVPSTVSAQDVDARWLPWLGCWEAVDGGEEAPLLCVRPTTQGDGVEFVSWAEGTETASDPILADGLARNVEREECTGVEEARFSDDGRRVYLKSQYVCEGGREQNASGILAMVNPMEWVDIKAVEGTPWVLRYRLARASRVAEAGIENVVASRASSVKTARIMASGRLTEADLIEAAGKVDAAALEALIVERGDPFAVDAAMLVRLDDAKVPASVIDLAIAVSFPERFSVKSGTVPMAEYVDEAGYTPRRQIYMGSPYGNSPYYGYGYSPYYGYGYGSYGYGYGYAGYGYGGYGYGGYGYQPRPVVVQPRSYGGSMIKGQGYSRGGSSSGTARGYAQPRSGSSASGSSGGTRSTSSPGVRSTGGSRSTGRTAKPRGGGGGTGSSGPSKVRPGGGGLI